MTKDFEDLKKAIVSDYVDNYSEDDNDKDLAIKYMDTYPDLKIEVNNSKMDKYTTPEDIMYGSEHDNIFIIKNENELQDKTFTLDDNDKWIAL